LPRVIPVCLSAGSNSASIRWVNGYFLHQEVGRAASSRSAAMPPIRPLARVFQPDGSLAGREEPTGRYFTNASPSGVRRHAK
jgi:hypothetical protein